jgi:hypothetical protein
MVIWESDLYKVVVPSTTKVKVKDAIVFKRGNHMVGRLTARYDFKDLPPELHQTALGMIDRCRVLRLPMRGNAALLRRLEGK